jgi:integrase
VVLGASGHKSPVVFGLENDDGTAFMLYQDLGLVFTNEDGAPVALDAATKAFARIARDAKLEGKGLSFHSLRHTCASWALAGGSDVCTTASLLGHSSPAVVLSVYGHVVAGMQERAVGVIGEALEAAQAQRAAAKNRPA